jgi:D-arabinose 1-dehydrogenase-like Zn-dependent alcohol dehydrogenase
MKAAVVPRLDGQWELAEVPMVHAGPGQVLIRVHACGVCHNDILCGKGVFGQLPLNPMTFGHEAAGTVVELGAGVTSRRTGDRVGATWVQATCGRCDACRANLPLSGQAGMSCPEAVMSGLSVPGGHAEYIAVTVASTVLIPDEVSFELAAPMLCAGYTSWSALRAAQPQPHERVAVVGIGGLGHLALQFSRACGFETVAVTRTADKHEVARDLGADHVVSNGAELAELGGADVVLVTGISNQSATDALQGLRINGRLVLANIDPVGSFEIGPASPVWARRQQIIGSTHNGLNYLAEALDLVAAGKVRPMVEVFGSDHLNDAISLVEKGEVRFRTVITY